jgi:hypothetical protein
MSRVRVTFGLATLLGWLSFFALACAVVTTGSTGLGTAFQVCFLLSLGWAIVMSISASSSRRCFWVGYLVFAVLYYAAMWNKLNWLGIENKALPVYTFVEGCVERLHPRSNTGGGWELPQEGKVAWQALHRVLAIAFGCIAGILARFVYNQRTSEED